MNNLKSLWFLFRHGWTVRLRLVKKITRGRNPITHSCHTIKSAIETETRISK